MASRLSLAPYAPGVVPVGFDSYRRGSVRGWVWAEARSWLTSVLGADQTLYEWAASMEARTEFRGRGRVYSVPAPLPGPSGADQWAVRHYFRGGAMAMHMVDRYLRLGHPRPWRELAASEAARSRGVRTPAVVGAAVYLDGACYRADLVTEVVPHARTLATVLFEQDGSRGWAVAMSRAGALIRRLAESGVFHVDLNAHNILLPDDASADAIVVDLDRARILRRASASASEKMQARLTRSIVKVGTPTGEHLRDSEIQAALARRWEGE